MTLKERFDTWYSEALGLVASLGALLDPGLLIGALAFVWAKISTIFTMLSITAFTVAPNVDVLGAFAGILQGAAVAAALLMVLKLGSRLKNNDNS